MLANLHNTLLLKLPAIASDHLTLLLTVEVLNLLTLLRLELLLLHLILLLFPKESPSLLGGGVGRGGDVAVVRNLLHVLRHGALSLAVASTTG